MKKTNACKRCLLPSHPAVKILLWVSFTLLLQMQSGYYMLLLAGFVIAAAIMLRSAHFVALLRRTRWIMLSVLLIYGYADQGVALWQQLGILSPHVEGLNDGLQQIFRLLAMLAALALLLNSMTMVQLLGGLYTLMFPVSVLGNLRERLVVRLALTLRYAENMNRHKSDNWRESVFKMLEPIDTVAEVVELPNTELVQADFLWLVFSAVLLTGALI